MERIGTREYFQPASTTLSENDPEALSFRAGRIPAEEIHCAFAIPFKGSASKADKYPDLQIILGHWGEVVLFYLERLGSLARMTNLQRPIADYFKQNLYVTPNGMWSQFYLQRSLEEVGPERILFSTNCPYLYRPGRPGLLFIEEALCLWSRRNYLLTGTGSG